MLHLLLYLLYPNVYVPRSQPDTQWTEKLFSNLLKGLDPATARLFLYNNSMQ